MFSPLKDSHYGILVLTHSPISSDIDGETEVAGIGGGVVTVMVFSNYRKYI